MSNDNKTLADVQPGGRVRLGDQAERARFEEWYVQNAFDYEANPIGSRDCALMRKAWNAALSAQPSPGGQGGDDCDLLAELRDVEECLYYGESNPIHAATVRAAINALAARQPVGVDDATDRALGETIEQRDRCEEVADELADHIAAITGVDIGEHSSANCPWQNAIEAAEEYRPAQAVDLSPSQSVLAEVAQERARQEAKWGQQNHADWTPTLAATDLAGAWPAGVGDHFKFITDYKAKGAEGHRLGYFDILMEEVAEAHDEARDGDTKATRAELVQVAAVAVAWIECIDRRLALTDSQAEVSRG
ncbi:hypothetical protein ACUDTH_02900 [Stenotrophomonas pavanii]|uniref:hypothetical protein n=1 Tax=Stenotrophomonas pavanii TaxID=487698 RepID=UPI0040423635